ESNEIRWREVGSALVHPRAFALQAGRDVRQREWMRDRIVSGIHLERRSPTDVLDPKPSLERSLRATKGVRWQELMIEPGLVEVESPLSHRVFADVDPSTIVVLLFEQTGEDEGT